MRFEALKENLLRGGIAPRHVRRYLGELEDHLVELIRCEEDAGYDPEEAAIRARAALGPDEELADAMLKQRDFRSISARAPWLVFGIVPPFALIAGFVLPILLMIFLARFTGMLPGHGHGFGMLPPWFRELVHAVSLILNMTVAPLLLAGLAITAQRQRLNPVWPLLATGLLLMFFFRLVIVIRPPGHPAQIQLTSFLAALLIGKPRMALGAGPTWQVAVQIVLTLLPAMWLFHANWKRQTQSAR